MEVAGVRFCLIILCMMLSTLSSTADTATSSDAGRHLLHGSPRKGCHGPVERRSGVWIRMGCRMVLRGGYNPFWEVVESDSDTSVDVGHEFFRDWERFTRPEGERGQQGEKEQLWDVNYWETAEWKAKAKEKMREKESVRWKTRGKYATMNFKASKEWWESWDQRQHEVPEEERAKFEAAENVLQAEVMRRSEGSAGRGDDHGLSGSDASVSDANVEGDDDGVISGGEGGEAGASRDHGGVLQPVAKKPRMTAGGEGEGDRAAEKARYVQVQVRRQGMPWPPMEDCMHDTSSSVEESEYSVVDGEPAVVHVVAGLIDSDPASLPPETAACMTDSLHLAKIAGPGTVVIVHSGKHRVEGYPGAGSIVRLEPARWTRIKGRLLDGYYPLKSIHPAMMRYPGAILHSSSWIIAGSQPAAGLIRDSQPAASSPQSAGEGSKSHSGSSSRGRLEASNVGFEMHGTTIEVGEGGSLDARVCDVRSIGGTSIILCRSSSATLDECNIGGADPSHLAWRGLDVGDAANLACFRSKVALCLREAAGVDGDAVHREGVDSKVADQQDGCGGDGGDAARGSHGVGALAVMIRSGGSVQITRCLIWRCGSGMCMPGEQGDVSVSGCSFIDVGRIVAGTGSRLRVGEDNWWQGELWHPPDEGDSRMAGG